VGIIATKRVGLELQRLPVAQELNPSHQEQQYQEISELASWLNSLACDSRHPVFPKTLVPLPLLASVDLVDNRRRASGKKIYLRHGQLQLRKDAGG
jgi:hypothetical protein